MGEAPVRSRVARVETAERAFDGAWLVWIWDWQTETASWWAVAAVCDTESEALDRADELKPRRSRR